MSFSSTPANILSQMLKNRVVSATEVTKEYLSRIERMNSDLHAYLTVGKEEAIRAARRVDALRAKGLPLPPLAGIPIAVKDNIVTKGIRTTCGSKMLEHFVPDYDATVVERLKSAGMIVLGKTNLDEFAMGSTGEYSGFENPRNPQNHEIIPGGSSSGSAVAVSAGLACVALGSDTGGSVRTPALCCDLVGFKPSYGAVSRYGLIAFASSMDQIGILARTVCDVDLLARVLFGTDEKDATTVPISLQREPIALHGVTIGIPSEYWERTGEENQTALYRVIECMRKEGAVIKKISLPTTPYLTSIYYILSSAEAASNLARYDGIHSGEARDEPPTALRSKLFGPEVKRRILLGNFVLSAGYRDAYYERALRARGAVIREYQAAFEEVDLLLTPMSVGRVPKCGEFIVRPARMYDEDLHTVAANLAGLPAISLIVGRKQGLPIGAQLLAPRFSDEFLLQAAQRLEICLAGGVT